MSLISHFRSFNSSFQKCRLKIANREWKMFHGELSAAANKYWCVFSGRIIYTEKEWANFQTGRPFVFTKFKMNAQQVPQCKQRRVTYLLTYIFKKKKKKKKKKREQHRVLSTSTCAVYINTVISKCCLTSEWIYTENLMSC